jgi:hypothetical protein
MKTTAKLGSRRSTGSVRRISISLPERIFRQLDQMVAQRGLENSSKAIAEMISHFVLTRREAVGDQVMAGMIALVYDEDRGALAQRLFELGPVRLLNEITDRIFSCEGVLSCKLTLTDIVIPHGHSMPIGGEKSSNRVDRKSRWEAQVP